MPIDSTLLLMILGITVLTGASPGPDIFYITSNALTGEWRRGLAAWAGIFTGALVWAVTTALGLTVLFNLVPVLYDIIKWAGVAYLFYIAYGFLHSAMRPGDVTINVAPPRTLSRVYIGGVVMNLLNPKALVFFSAILPQFINPALGHVWFQLLISGVASVLLGVTIYLGYLYAGVVIGRRVRHNPGFIQKAGLRRWLEAVAGALYLFFAISLLLWKRSTL
jgi:threonine/homoserine/homoserine lactone efflux protein